MDKLDDIDGFFIATITQDESGLPYDVFIDILGKDNDIDNNPRVGVIVNDMVLYVSISDEPECISGIYMYGEEKIFEWVKTHKDILLDHWNKVISDREALNALCKKGK
ncbi:MAG: hypothetical protein K5921_11320 [Lachnospiraceae bacterium]|nr:hypothetical protein [Lachnospiraceae bacterium]